MTATRLLSVEPYHFSLHSIGYIAISGFVGALLATFFGGKLIDIIANRMTENAGGRRESEYRLVGLIPPVIIGLSVLWEF